VSLKTRQELCAASNYGEWIDNLHVRFFEIRAIARCNNEAVHKGRERFVGSLKTFASTK